MTKGDTNKDQIASYKVLEDIANESLYMQRAIRYIETIKSLAPEQKLSEDIVQYLFHVFNIKAEFFRVMHYKKT